MNSFSAQSELDRLMEACGAPRGSLFLRYSNREGFFEKAVQEILMERHPTRCEYENPQHWGYPIHAWTVAEQLAIGTNPYDGTEIDAIDFGRADRKWFSRLTIAAIDALENRAARSRNPQTTLEKFVKWRNDLYLWETSRIDPLPAPQNYTEALASILGKGVAGKDPTGTVRKAIHDENARRDKVWKSWAEPWKVYVTGTPTQRGAMDLAAQIIARSNMLPFNPPVSNSPLPNMG